MYWARLQMLAALLLCGCGGPPPPKLEGIEPAEAAPREQTEVLIFGDAFLAEPSGEARGAVYVDDRFRAWIGRVALVRVRRLDERTLTAVIPPLLDEGTYALTLEGPYGKDHLDAAFTVRGTSLSLESDGAGDADEPE